MRQLRSELVALRTTRALVGHLAAAALLGLLPLLLLPLLTGSDVPGGAGVPDLGTLDGQRVFLSSGSNALLIAAVLGSVMVTSRHRHRTIVGQLLVTPRRGRAVAAQVGALVLGGVLVGLVLAGLTSVSVVGALALLDEQLVIGAATFARVVAAGALAGAVGAALGAGVGAVVRNTGGAVALVVVVLAIVEGLVASALPDVGQWFPSVLLATVEGGRTDGVTVAAAAAGLLAYAVVATAAGAAATIRRDVI